MSFKKDFGARLKVLRKQRGFSQEKFSEMINVAQNTLSNIENGVNFCSADTIEKILTALNIVPRELFNFGQKDPQLKMLDEINELLIKNPQKIEDFLKVLKALTD